MTNKKMFLKSAASFLAVSILVGSFPVTVGAAGDQATDAYLGGSAAADARTAEIMGVVGQYMADRASTLVSKTAVLDEDSAIAGVIADEAAHLDFLDEKGISVVKSEYHIQGVSDEEWRAVVMVLEEAEYLTSDGSSSAQVWHEIDVMWNGDGVAQVARDQYREDETGFYSCSYVVPEAQTYKVVAGSGSCISYVAQTQVGYHEKASNDYLDSFTENSGSNDYTKYGAWFGQNNATWCAIFVAWCADQVGSCPGIVPKEASPVNMMTEFQRRGVYHRRDSGYTPKAGDIFFEGTSEAKHTGIVISVSSTQITVVDGNYSDQVSQHTYSRTDSALMGYASPSYPCSDHTYNYSAPYYICETCGYKTTNVPVLP